MFEVPSDAPLLLPSALTGVLPLRQWQAEELQAKRDAMEAANEQMPRSLVNLLALLPCLAVVVVQDALELIDEFPQPLAHQLLLGNATFR